MTFNWERFIVATIIFLLVGAFFLGVFGIWSTELTKDRLQQTAVLFASGGIALAFGYGVWRDIHR